MLKVVLSLQALVGGSKMTAKVIGQEYKGHKIINSFGTMFEIKALGKGTVNKDLRGMYTSAAAAMHDIDRVKSIAAEKDNGTKQTG